MFIPSLQWLRLRLCCSSPNGNMYIRTKPVTMYELRGKIFAFMVVVLVVAFLFVASQYNHTVREPDRLVKAESVFKNQFQFQGVTTTRPQKVNKNNDIYAVVFDAGSTGSRVHVFHFTSKPDGSLELVEEIFEQLKPGLSAYESDPRKAAESLVPLVNKALAVVPSTVQKLTPLNLFATAGLRLLSEGTADNILNEVKLLLRGYPFHLREDDVTIMDGVDEGIFSWMTVNFMLGALTGRTESVAALDLGGGSTQITFIPKQQYTLENAPRSFLKNVSLFKNSYTLYTHSYLGLGLMATRFTLMGGDSLQESTELLPTVCLPNEYSGLWSYGGKEYKVRGHNSTAGYSYNNCLSQMKSLKKIDLVMELSQRKIYIFSYFYDRALESGLIGPEGGDILVKDYQIAAKKAFISPDKENPFHALDVTFMYYILHEGYGIPDDNKVHLAKKISGVEVSWGLGSAFQLLSSSGLAR